MGIDIDMLVKKQLKIEVTRAPEEGGNQTPRSESPLLIPDAAVVAESSRPVESRDPDMPDLEDASVADLVVPEPGMVPIDVDELESPRQISDVGGDHGNVRGDDAESSNEGPSTRVRPRDEMGIDDIVEATHKRTRSEGNDLYEQARKRFTAEFGDILLPLDPRSLKNLKKKIGEKHRDEGRKALSQRFNIMADMVAMCGVSWDLRSMLDVSVAHNKEAIRYNKKFKAENIRLRESLGAEQEAKRALEAQIEELKNQNAAIAQDAETYRNQLDEAVKSALVAKEDAATCRTLKDDAEKLMAKHKLEKEKAEKEAMKLQRDLTNAVTRETNLEKDLSDLRIRVDQQDEDINDLGKALLSMAKKGFQDAVEQVKVIAPDLDLSSVSYVNEVRDGVIRPKDFSDV